jgi:hypothetical protein
MAEEGQQARAGLSVNKCADVLMDAISGQLRMVNGVSPGQTYESQHEKTFFAGTWTVANGEWGLTWANV